MPKKKKKTPLKCLSEQQAAELAGKLVADLHNGLVDYIDALDWEGDAGMINKHKIAAHISVYPYITFSMARLFMLSAADMAGKGAIETADSITENCMDAWANGWGPAVSITTETVTATDEQRQQMRDLRHGTKH